MKVNLIDHYVYRIRTELIVPVQEAQYPPGDVRGLLPESSAKALAEIIADMIVDAAHGKAFHDIYDDEI